MNSLKNKFINKMGNHNSTNSNSLYDNTMKSISNESIPESPAHNKVAIFHTHLSPSKGKIRKLIEMPVKIADRSR